MNTYKLYADGLHDGDRVNGAYILLDLLDDVMAAGVHELPRWMAAEVQSKGNRAEAYAIGKGIERAEELRIGRLKIYSDSRVAVAWYRRSRPSRALRANPMWSWIRRLRRVVPSVQYYWVSRQNPMLQRVDRLCRMQGPEKSNSLALKTVESAIDTVPGVHEPIQV